MKCYNAREMLRSQREQAHRDMHSILFFEFIDCMVSLQMIAQHGWSKKRLKRMYDSERPHVAEWMYRYSADGGKVKGHRGYRDISAEQLALQNMDTVQEQIDKHLADFGFTYDPDLLVPPKFRSGWKKYEQSEAAWRMMWYTTGGSQASRLYFTCLLVYLHDECGFGAERLRKIFDPVVQEIRWYVGKLFTGTVTDDLALKQRIDEAHKEIEKRGIELEQIKVAEVVGVRKESKPEEIPAGLENLAWSPEDIKNTTETERRIVYNGKLQL